MTDLSVIIVSYNVRAFLEQCLVSVERAMNDMEVDVWVVDNRSVDGSVDMVRERFPWVRVIANEDNVGFSVANNQAIRACAGRHVLLLNPDTVVGEDTFKCVWPMPMRIPSWEAWACRCTTARASICRSPNGDCLHLGRPSVACRGCIVWPPSHEDSMGTMPVMWASTKRLQWTFCPGHSCGCGKKRWTRWGCWTSSSSCTARTSI